MAEDEFTNFAIGLMKDFLGGAGIPWVPVQLHEPQINTDEASVRAREQLLQDMKVIAVNDDNIYQKDFFKAFICMSNSRTVFKSYFHGPIYRRYLEPFSESNFKRYMAYLFYFVLFVVMNGFTLAPEHAVTTLVRLFHERPELLNSLKQTASTSQE